MILKYNSAKVENQNWGCLTWFASAALGNSDKMTVGECRISPGCENPRHNHPNCDEILHVLEGTIIHSFGNEIFEMKAGDTITIPSGIVHNARNTGIGQAVMTIVFTSPCRETIGE